MKKVLSLAIAAALVAPAAVMADATLFGKAHFVIQNTDTTIDDGDDTNDGDVSSVDSVHSRIGVKGSEDLGDGLTAVYHFEFKVHQDDGQDGLGNRNQYVGLAGGFGTFLLGRHDTPLKMSQGAFDEFGDLPNGDINSVMPGEDRVDNVIAYVSPAMSGLTLAGALVSGENGDGSDVGDDDALVSLYDHFSLAALYSNGPIFASLAYNSYDLGAAAPDNDPNLLRGTFVWNGGTWQAGVMYNKFSLDDLDLGAVDADLAGVAAEDADSYGVSGHFMVTPNDKIKAQYLNGDGQALYTGDIGFSPSVGVAAGNDGLEVTQWSIGYEHAFSKRTTVHAGYTNFEYKDNDNEETALFAGVIHDF